jgi:hypothetical protein
MASEDKLASGIQIATNLTGSYGDVDDDPDSPDGNWYVWDGAGNSTCRAEMADPTSDPDVGVDLQEFKVQIRKDDASGGNDPGWELALWELEGGTYSEVAVLATGTVTTLTGEVITGNFNANLLTTPSGVNALISIDQTSGGTGNPTNQRGLSVGGFKWVVDLGTPAGPQFPYHVFKRLRRKIKQIKLTL